MPAKLKRIVAAMVGALALAGAAVAGFHAIEVMGALRDPNSCFAFAARPGFSLCSMLETSKPAP
jgi:hypothetical protein